MAEKEAFCLLLWIHQGGQVNNKNRKIVDTRVVASGYCDDPTDCYRCSLMHAEIAQHPPGYVNWVCPACITSVISKAKNQGKSIHMTGHYTEGRCQFIECTRPPRVEYGDSINNDISWTEEDLVERPSGYSRFLQLIIGDINS